ncbi:hypothetical protein [Blastococcus atacamensis]|uniref:hypothetical protein n=1 Tax=Blastococcus atacamensis TaxID=2070508 RepID=UPI001E63D83F|nr:hypothetical protein [Blastococcus atacamensis]
MTAVRDNGLRAKESREGPGIFGHYGEAAAWWFTGRDIAHVEVSDPTGVVTVLHHVSFPPDDCWMCGSAERTLVWRALQDHDDPEPYGVMAWDAVTGQHYLYVRGEGLVPWPALVAYTMNGEPGSRAIAQNVALQLIADGVTRVEAGSYDAQLHRGQGPTLPVPTASPKEGGPGSVDVARAIEVARSYHLGQTDKAGRDYFQSHVADVHRRVAGESSAVQAVALLHDVLEDTPCTEFDLRREFPDDVVDAVVAITHLPNEPRQDYYGRVRANPLARTVKLADIASNTDPDRLALLDESTRDRLAEKYRAALLALE